MLYELIDLKFVVQILRNDIISLTEDVNNLNRQFLLCGYGYCSKRVPVAVAVLCSHHYPCLTYITLIFDCF